MLSLLAPMLTGAFSVISLYAQNVDQALLSSAVIPLVVVLVGSLLFALFLRWLLRDNGRAGFLATVWLFLFFLYGHINNLIIGKEIAGFVVGRNLFLMPATLLVAALFLLLAFRAPALCQPLTQYIMVSLGIMIVLNLAMIAMHKLQSAPVYVVDPTSDEGIELSTSSPEQMPDIYYIIVDRYANWDTLKEYFNYDNSDFEDYLRQSGFYVAEQSVANYHRTDPSLASSLNMQYLQQLVEVQGKNTSYFMPLYTLIEHHDVGSMLKKLGYEYVHIGSWWQPTRYNRYADENINYFTKTFGLFELDGFSKMLFDTTMLSSTNPFTDNLQEQRDRTFYVFDQLAGIPDRPEPTFVFAHILMPHEPFIFGPNGEELDPPPFYYTDSDLTTGQIDELKQRYVEQLRFTNKLLESLFNQILAKSKKSPIIILQSDEGPYNFEFVQKGEGWSTDTLRLHMRNLNAYYLPGDAKKYLYPSISPVNSFRVIFDAYFQGDFPLLEDRSYVWENPNRIYSFVDVTDQVKFEP
ncbi:MAG: hypothetical protein HYX89_01160 [Chloroflexi bacterium]|nr:hypothetical protein [Chloroflexota bacterium]